MKPLCVILVVYVVALANVAQGQNIADYRLLFGLSTGYRYMDMTEVNSDYGGLGFGNAKPDISALSYSYRGEAKPYHNTVTLSGFITWKPFKKNGLTFTLQYDYLPDAARDLSGNETYLVYGNKGDTATDTAISVYHAKSHVNIQTTCAIFGYDIPYQKFLFNVGIGFSYNTFLLAGDEWQRLGSTQFNFLPLVLPDAYRVYGKANGFGFLARISASYQLSKRISAHLQFTTHATEMTISDIPYVGTIVWYQRTIPVTDTYSINIVDYLSAQLSGVQLSGGVCYKIF